MRSARVLAPVGPGISGKGQSRDSVCGCKKGEAGPLPDSDVGLDWSDQQEALVPRQPILAIGGDSFGAVLVRVSVL